jgi:hypothetical protein
MSLENIRLEILDLRKEVSRAANALEVLAGGQISLAELEELRELADEITINRLQEGSYVSEHPLHLSKAADLIDALLDRDSRGEPL